MNEKIRRITKKAKKLKEKNILKRELREVLKKLNPVISYQPVPK